MRKFWLTVLSILSFTILHWKIPNVDSFNLGLAIGALLSPTMFANAAEWKFKK